MRWLTSLDAWLVFVVSFALTVVAIVLGRAVGQRVRARDPEGADLMPAVESALLGLLSLMIGFTLTLSLGRLQARQAAVLHEAAAIEAAWSRASLLPQTEATPAQDLLRRYLADRLALGEPGSRPRERAELVDGSREIRQALARQARDAMSQDARSQPAALFVAALDTLGDVDQERLMADRIGVPHPVYETLYGLAIVAFGYLGFVSGAKGARNTRSNALLAAAFVMVITIVADLDRPQAGLVVVSQRPLQDAAVSLR